MRREDENSAELLECDFQTRRRGEDEGRNVGDVMCRAGAVPVIAETAFRLFHGLADRVEIVADGDHGKEQNERATERADDYKRRPSGMARRNPSPPQQVSGQQQGEPAEIKKKLHLN